MLRILVVAQDQVWLDAVSKLIAQEPDLAVSATMTALDLDRDARSLTDHDCDLLVLHHELGVTSSLDFLLKLSVRQHDRPVVVAGIPEQDSILMSYFEHGVSGYVQQGDPLDHLLTVVRAAGSGQTHVPPQVAATLVARLVELSRAIEYAAPGIPPMSAPRLTSREQEILQLVATEKTHKEISVDMIIEIDAISDEINRILDKLGIPDSQRATPVALHSDVASRDIPN